VGAVILYNVFIRNIKPSFGSFPRWFVGQHPLQVETNHFIINKEVFMSDKQVPFVAIIGGFYHMSDPVEIDRAHKMAREIGVELAKAGMGLVVYFSDPVSLEPHVVTGYVQATPPGTGAGRIRVRFAESQRNQVFFAEQATRDELFKLDYFPGQDWENPFYRSLAAAEGVDAVLLMAGKTSTRIAGQIALARKLPVLAIDEFDGSAKDIRRELATLTQDYPSTKTCKLSEMVTWLKKQADARAQELARMRHDEEHYRRIISQTSKGLWTGSSFIVLLIVLALGMQQSPPTQWYFALTLLGLVMAGATGALVRSYYWGTKDVAPYTSVIWGGVAGLVVGAAYLIPQLFGAPGVLDPKAMQVTATDKIQFMSAIMVAIPAGVGFDTIFNRLKNQAQEQAIIPPDTKQ
jgi:hypothetical protein